MENAFVSEVTYDCKWAASRRWHQCICEECPPDLTETSATSVEPNELQSRIAVSLAETLSQFSLLCSDNGSQVTKAFVPTVVAPFYGRTHVARLDDA